MEAVLTAGQQSGQLPRMVVPGQNGQPRDPITHLMYTSGSSGRPKGAEYHEHLFQGFLKVCSHSLLSELGIVVSFIVV